MSAYLPVVYQLPRAVNGTIGMSSNIFTSLCYPVPAWFVSGVPVKSCTKEMFLNSLSYSSIYCTVSCRLLKVDIFYCRSAHLLSGRADPKSKKKDLSNKTSRSEHR